MSQTTRQAVRLSGLTYLGALILAILAGTSAADAAVVTSLKMSSDPADIVGGGADYFYSSADGTFDASKGSDGAITIQFLTNDQNTLWLLVFQAPFGQDLTPGTYTGAREYPGQLPSEPGQSISGNGVACGSSIGEFKVLEIAYGPGNTLNAFRATFDRHCGQSLSGLRGEIRYQANVYVEIAAPAHLAMLAGQPMSFDVTATALNGGPVTLGSSGIPGGATFTDAGNGTGHFAWTPSLGQTGFHTMSFSASDDQARGESVSTEIAVGQDIHVPADQPGIQAAIQSAIPGSRILVAPGTYSENIDFLGKALTVISEAGPATTIIDGGNSGPVATFGTLEGRGSLLSGFTLRNGRAIASAPPFHDGGGVAVDEASPTIYNNIITGNYSCRGGGVFIDFGSPLIQVNRIQGNTADCGSGGGGIGVGGAARAEIVGNLISGNTATFNGGGILLTAAGTPTIQRNIILSNGAQDGGGISMTGNSNPEIVENLIAGNQATTGGGVKWQVGNGARGPRLVGNTIADNDSSIGSAVMADGYDAGVQLIGNLMTGRSGQIAFWCSPNFDPATPVLRFNDVHSAGTTGYGPSCTDPTGTSGNLSVQPAYQCPSRLDYRLIAGTAVIDAGDGTAPGLPAVDLSGGPRTLDGNNDGTPVVDIGAYEFDPAVPPDDTCINISCPADVQAEAPFGTTSAVVTYPDPIVPANATSSCTPASGSSFPGGANTVTCTASLATGPTASCTFTVTVIVRPANDTVAHPTAIPSLPFTDLLDTRNATADPADPECSGPEASVWYTFTPTQNLLLTADATGSSYAVNFAAYVMTGGALSKIACGSAGDPLTFSALAGQTIWLQAGSPGAGGTLGLTLSGIPAISVAIAVDPNIIVDGGTGLGTVNGTLTCARDVGVLVEGSLTYGRRGSQTTSLFQVQVDCHGTTHWSSPVNVVVGPTGRGKASLRVKGTAYDIQTQETAIDETGGAMVLKDPRRPPAVLFPLLKAPPSARSGKANKR